jgi:hypothetical protein
MQKSDGVANVRIWSFWRRKIDHPHKRGAGQEKKDSKARAEMFRETATTEKSPDVGQKVEVFSANNFIFLKD